MQLHTEVNSKQFMHRQSLPRGYFKKRKHEPEDARPPDIAKMTRTFSPNVNYLDCVNIKRVLKCLLVLTLWIGAIASQVHASTIEPDLKVLSLETTVAPVMRQNNTSKNCVSMTIKIDHEYLDRLRNCRVIEGSVVIVLMDELSEADARNYSFPELVEITGYLMLYRISGFKSLSQLFPNLAVIRGRELFKAYSLIVYECETLEDIGLVNLQTIERGHVRIEKNIQLCFADRVDWSLIAGPGEHHIENNKLSHLCPVCGGDCPKVKGSSRQLCWNQTSCQVKCDCKGNVCSTIGKKCCDSSCAGGCDENNPRKCKACKRFSVGIGKNVECRDTCPPDTFEYLDRRCLSEKNCHQLNKVLNQDLTNALPFIPFKKTCMIGCPAGYNDYKDGNVTKCKECGNECLKRCQSKIIDSIFAAQSLKGCAIIEGALEIKIRSTKAFDSSASVVKELENSLSDIEVIQDYLKIARSFPIQSLSFLKKLRVIKGENLESNRYSLIIWDNQNLQELWKDQPPVEIKRGLLLFHMNPRLCFYKIESLATNVSKIANIENARLSNGDKTPCNITLLEVNIAEIYPEAVLFNWKPLKLEDARSLLGYVVYYIPAKHQNVTLWNGRDACGNDGWLVDDVKDFLPNADITYPLTKLEPYTQYAYYITAYTLSTEKTGAQSDISYFRTLPGKPHAVTKLKATPKSSSAIDLSWEPPRKVNGKLSHYILRVRMMEKNDQILDQRDYCLQPFEQTEPISKNEVRPPPEPPKSMLDIDGHCDCQSCAETCQRPMKEGDDQRQSAIEFEDEIQDFVYVKQEVSDELDNKENRAKREVQVVDDTDKDNAKKKDSETESILNADGDYTYFYRQINDSTQLSFELTQLRHYSHYQVWLRACREKSDEPLPSDTLDEQCGQETQISTLTLKREENDLIPFFDAQYVNSNGSAGWIKVSWKAPPKPNGLLLSYTIRYRKSDIEHTKWEYSCIPHKVFLNQSFYILKYLSNGNYSVQIAATSSAGMGNYTTMKYVLINENTGNGYVWTVLWSCLIVLVVISAGLIYFIKQHYLKNISNMKLIANVNPDYAGVQYRLDDWEVDREKVLQLQELGQGSFGMVYEGVVKDLNVDGGETRCAIKTVNENATDKERISFLNEASVMKQFDTAFVVRLLGVVSQSQPTMVIMELMHFGDLKGFLRLHRADYEPPPGQVKRNPPTVRQILQMAAEIADGMSYLSAKKFVHRDLAARNCMVAESLIVKIGDFGMTRDIYETDYYRKGTKGLLPVRWMSPESLKDGVFTSSSDVFSFGVVMWEMATLASQPYQGLSNDQVLRYVIDGGVMERPENCPDKLYEMMRRCWQHRPSARPTFMDIIEMLLDEVNQNFRNVAFYFTKDGQDALHQQRQSVYSVNITDDVTTPLRQGEEEETSSVDGNHFLMERVNSSNKFHEQWEKL